MTPVAWWVEFEDGDTAVYPDHRYEDEVCALALAAALATPIIPASTQGELRAEVERRVPWEPRRRRDVPAGWLASGAVICLDSPTNDAWDDLVVPADTDYRPISWAEVEAMAKGDAGARGRFGRSLRASMKPLAIPLICAICGEAEDAGRIVIAGPMALEDHEQRAICEDCARAAVEAAESISRTRALATLTVPPLRSTPHPR